MSFSPVSWIASPTGQNDPRGELRVHASSPRLNTDRDALLAWFEGLGLLEAGEWQRGEAGLAFRLHPELAGSWAPGCDTLELSDRLGLKPVEQRDDLCREILLSMLAGPVAYAYPGHEELQSAVRVRQRIVEAARGTLLAFDTDEAVRPPEYWAYDERTGFTLQPGARLEEALLRTLNPGHETPRYSFSCYRATEYVYLLGLAQELEQCNPTLAHQLQQQWEQRAILSTEFHDVFTREYCGMATPMPLQYYVPGDRVWFRNPHEPSSNAEGYEGSWVFYLGQGRFANFWKRDQPYTLQNKCVELFHWRNATYRDKLGRLRVDDDEVDERVARSLQDPEDLRDILAQMMRVRDPFQVYAGGGCVDATRECLRFLCPGTTDIRLPGAQPPAQVA